MRHILVIAWLAGALSWLAPQSGLAAAPGQPGSKPALADTNAALPGVDQILAANVKAIGGPAALQKVSSRTVKGTVEIPAMGVSDMPWEQWNKAPNQRLTLFKVAGVGEMLEGFDGTVLWSKGPDGKVTEKKGEEMARSKRECEFYRELKFKELYPQLTVRGRQRLGDAETYLVEAKPASGGVETFFFDVQTGLLLRWDSGFENEAGKIDIKVRYRDHRAVDGLKLPHTIDLEVSPAGGAAIHLTVKCAEIRHNVPIDDAKFKKPAE